MITMERQHGLLNKFVTLLGSDFKKVSRYWHEGNLGGGGLTTPSPPNPNPLCRRPHARNLHVF